MTGLLGAFQIVHASFVFSLGGQFRRPIYRNYVFLVLYAVIFFIISYVTLANPNPLGCLLHVNCGTPAALAQLGYIAQPSPTSPAPSWLLGEFHSATGHNVMPLSFRWTLWILMIVNGAATLAWEGVVILGPVKQWARKKWPQRRTAVIV